MTNGKNGTDAPGVATLTDALDEVDVVRLVDDLAGPIMVLRFARGNTGGRGARRRAEAAEARIRRILFMHLVRDRDGLNAERRQTLSRATARAARATRARPRAPRAGGQDPS